MERKDRKDRKDRGRAGADGDADSKEKGGARGRLRRRPKGCRFCLERAGTVDYKAVGVLRRLTTIQGKLHARRRSGLCRAHQAQVKRAVKHARYLALLPTC